MQQVYQVLGWPLGWIMWLFYQFIKNYGLLLLIFTIITKLALFPLSLKQQKSLAKTQALKPQLDELQAKYKNNKEKLNEETMKLYQQEGFNPASGCLPLLIQMPILFGLIDVIYRPLTHLLRLSKDALDIAGNIALEHGLITQQQLGGFSASQLAIIGDVKANPGRYAELGADIVAKIQNLSMNFFGMNLGQTPSTDMFKTMFSGGWNPIILIPIISGVTALLVSFVSTRMGPSADAGGAGANASMKGMMYIMPLFSVMIAFQVPAGVGLYWIYSNLTAMLQTFILNKYYNPKEMAEKAKAERDERMEKERQERIEAKKHAKESGNSNEKSLSQKELNRRRLAEARRRDAEKYGEEYVEVSDDDLR